jgi:hypothetical protein
MNFLITSLFVLMVASVSSNLCLRLVRGRVGYLPQIESIKGKFRAYTKTVSPFTMFLATILLLVIFPFSMVALTLSIFSILGYSFSGIIAWKQYLSQEEEGLLVKQRIIASVLGNSSVIILWFWTIPLISKL